MTSGDHRRVFAGIDPGAKGAIALLDEGGGLVVLQSLPCVSARERAADPWRGYQTIATLIDCLTTDYFIMRIAIEETVATSRNGHLGRVTAIRHHQHLISTCLAHMLHPELVAWSAWREANGLPTTSAIVIPRKPVGVILDPTLRAAKDAASRARKAEFKAQSIARASDLWPEFAASFAGHDGRAEAALIARWCLHKGGGA